MTEIDSLDLPQHITIDYYTGPTETNPPAPPSINNHEDAVISTKACLQDFKSNNNPHYLNNYNGYLIACYSDHPLVSELQALVKPGTVVMGIFQASILYAMHYASSDYKAAILTSGRDWESLLDMAIIKFCASSQNKFVNDKFIPTLASDIPVLDLNKPESYPKIKMKIQNLINKKVGIILLGCAGLSCLNSKMKQDFPNIKFVDSVKVGVRILDAYIQIGNI
jgi:Asp/Glu/hydantoin racemase